VNNVEKSVKKPEIPFQSLFKAENYPQFFVEKKSKKLWIMWISYF